LYLVDQFFFSHAFRGREKRFLGAGKPPCAADFPTAAGGSVPIVTRFGRLSGHRAGPQQNNLVRMKQTRQLNWRRLPPSRSRGIRIVSATSWAMAMLMPPNDWTRSAS